MEEYDKLLSNKTRIVAVNHVSNALDTFITKMERDWNFNRHQIAERTSFMSHEPATPPRGGSAAAEIQALRRTFGDSASKVVIANTKGFTGHPMAVGIEDASMFYGMLTGRIPPIANHKENDPELGDLNLSTGGDYPELQYGLRFAAGFGSQIALSLVRRWPIEGERINGAILLAWARKLAGTDDVVMRILQNKLVAYCTLIGAYQARLFFQYHALFFSHLTNYLKDNKSLRELLHYFLN